MSKAKIFLAHFYVTKQFLKIENPKVASHQVSESRIGIVQLIENECALAS